MSGYFITATGTGIGKTLITCVLAHQLMKQGRKVRAVKPVITGFDAAHLENSDTGLLLAAQQMPINKQSIEACSPWRFAHPISPDMAAEDENRRIDFEQLIAFCHAKEEMLLVEGIGGVMVPIDTEHTVRDFIQRLGFPVILVAGTYLGTLSHTLEAAHAITSAGLKLQAVILSASENSPVPPERVEKSLKRFLPRETAFAHVGRLDSSSQLWKDVPDLTFCLK